MLHCTSLLFVFFKQKTAYELRISDWSSDVCSSDLSMISRIGSTSRRNSAISGPISRKLTGYGTGGPIDSRETRIRASGKLFWAIIRRIFPTMTSRYSAPPVSMTILAKAGSGGSGFIEMKNRGAPAPTKVKTGRAAVGKGGG